MGGGGAGGEKGEKRNLSIFPKFGLLFLDSREGLIDVDSGDQVCGDLLRRPGHTYSECGTTDMTREADLRMAECTTHGQIFYVLEISPTC